MHMENSKETFSMLNGEQKIKAGEQVDAERITLPDSEWEKIIQSYEKALETMNASFPHLEFRLSEASAVARIDGSLHILIPSYHTDGSGDKGSAIDLSVQRWHWDVDNDQLKKFSEVMLKKI